MLHIFLFPVPGMSKGPEASLGEPAGPKDHNGAQGFSWYYLISAREPGVSSAPGSYSALLSARGTAPGKLGASLRAG